VIPQGFSAFHGRIPEILEDGDNEMPDSYRAILIQGTVYRKNQPAELLAA
jgi:hypothetical protein